jgi:hypothetical protein
MPRANRHYHPKGQRIEDKGQRIKEKDKGKDKVNDFSLVRMTVFTREIVPVLNEFLPK